MNPDDFYKKCLEGAEIPAADVAGVKRVLEVIRSEPSVMSRAEPPAGYEMELLKSLSRKLPETKTAPASAAPHRRKEDRRWWIFNPGFSWSLSGTLAITVFALVIGLNRQSPIQQVQQDADLLTQAAKKGPNRMVASWVASVGDSATQMRVAKADINTIAEEAVHSQNSAAFSDALDAVAHRMGLRQ